MPSLKVPSSLSTLASQNILCCIYQLLTKEELQDKTELEVHNYSRAGSSNQYNTYFLSAFDDKYSFSKNFLF